MGTHTATTRRLDVLEAEADRVDPEPIMIVRRIVSPGHLDDEPTCAHIGDTVLMRAPDEAVDDFEGRAKAEALRQRVGRGPVPLVLLNSCDERAPSKCGELPT